MITASSPGTSGRTSTCARGECPDPRRSASHSPSPAPRLSPGPLIGIASLPRTSAGRQVRSVACVHLCQRQLTCPALPMLMAGAGGARSLSAICPVATQCLADVSPRRCAFRRAPQVLRAGQGPLGGCRLEASLARRPREEAVIPVALQRAGVGQFVAPPEGEAPRARRQVEFAHPPQTRAPAIRSGHNRRPVGQAESYEEQCRGKPIPPIHVNADVTLGSPAGSGENGI
jgi:hypothetical protein